MLKTLLVTGGAGFIGSSFIRLMLEKTEARIVNLDLLTYAGNLETLKDLEGNDNYTFIKGDICDPAAVKEILANGIDAIVNFAAESHVDRSIMSADPFVRTNIQGTVNLLDCAVEAGIERFVHVSTDEVYGSLEAAEPAFTEENPLAPNSPYAASKAAADLLCRSFHKTHDYPVVITRCSNNYGPYQFPEKLIPLMITNALEDRALPVYGDGMQIRDWIHVSDHCEAVRLVLEKGRPGATYNIGGGNEEYNLDIVKRILRALDKPESLIEFVTDRPGHDRRYAMDSTRIADELGWQPAMTFEDGIQATVDWYLANKTWWQNIKDGTYQAYYDQQYNTEPKE